MARNQLRLIKFLIIKICNQIQITEHHNNEFHHYYNFCSPKNHHNFWSGDKTVLQINEELSKISKKNKIKMNWLLKAKVTFIHVWQPKNYRICLFLHHIMLTLFLFWLKISRFLQASLNFYVIKTRFTSKIVKANQQRPP